jgi:hypothetical protein
MWLFIMRCVPAEGNGPTRLYELLSWPTRTPFEKIVSSQEFGEDAGDFRSLQTSPTSYFKCVGQGLYALCRRRGVARLTLKKLLLGIRRVALSCAMSDMGNVKSMGATERMCVGIGIKQTCYATLKLCEALPQDKASELLSASLKTMNAVSARHS